MKICDVGVTGIGPSIVGVGTFSYAPHAGEASANSEAISAQHPASAQPPGNLVLSLLMALLPRVQWATTASPRGSGAAEWRDGWQQAVARRSDDRTDRSRAKSIPSPSLLPPAGGLLPATAPWNNSGYPTRPTYTGRRVVV